jgi:hypothetical protein
MNGSALVSRPDDPFRVAPGQPARPGGGPPGAVPSAARPARVMIGPVAAAVDRCHVAAARRRWGNSGGSSWMTSPL